MYGIKLNDPQQAEAIQRQLAITLPEIAVSMSSEFAENLPDLKNMNVMMWGIGALAILVAASA